MQKLKFIEMDAGGRASVMEVRPAEFADQMDGADGDSRVRIVTDSDWEQLAPLCGDVEDRGSKHPAKGLNTYLCGRKRVPVLRAAYDSAGRCLQSVKALLRAAPDAAGVHLYLLAVEERIFGELVEQIEAGEETVQARVNRAPGAISADPNELILRQLGQVGPDHESRRKLMGCSVKVELARTMADRASSCDFPVLILGDSGTGKELTARLIHDCGERGKHGRFLAVNCAAIPDNLLESELFGSKKGAFTGATDKKGLWEMAQDGSLFLDEIGDLSLRHQAKVLRALEEKMIRRVGGDRDIPVNARIIAATHRDIEGKVRTEKFRQDLYYRLYGIRILLPSLDDAPEDIGRLAEYFWKGIVGKPSARLSHGVRAWLESMTWPGNGRQLKAQLKRVRQLFNTDEPDVEHFRLLALQESGGMNSNARPDAESGASVQMECLTHLRRTATALHSVELVLRRQNRNGGRLGHAAELSTVRWANLKMSVEEIRSLCREPVLFGSEALFRKIEMLVEALDDIDGMTDAPLEADVYDSGCTPEILERIESAMHDVFASTQALVSGL